jgi:hypothetical protein
MGFRRMATPTQYHTGGIMAKIGRPKGSRASKPKRGTVTNRVLLAFDAKDGDQWRYNGTGEIAKVLRCDHRLVIAALNRWRPDWRLRFWAPEALAERGNA